jgi:hydrogenase maturation protease
VKVLIAGVGHPNLKDLSFGQVLLPFLKQQIWTENFDFENLSFGAIAVLQWFQDFPDKYDRVVFVSAAEREGRAPGTLDVYKWDFAPLDEEVVQECVAESVTGIISLDNLMMILQYFKALPVDVVVLDLEPVDSEIGFECSPEITERFDEFSEIVREKATAKL